MTLLLALAFLLSPLSTAFAEDASPYRLEIPGQLLDIGSHRLHLHCEGEGQPAVIMDVGLGGSSYEWLAIQSDLAEEVQACTYDRAGYGWSEPGPKPRTSGRIATELQQLLEEAGVGGPYVLVGHSFGGYNMQLFARRNPSSVAALVLVDSSHADQVERYLAPPLRVKLAPEVKKGRHAYVRLARPKLHPSLPARLKGIVYAMLSHVTARRAIGSEYVGFRQSAREVKSAAPLPDDMPIFVITRGKRVWPEDKKGDRMEALWRELQLELAEQSSRHAHIVASNSGHHVHLDQPQLVLKVIRDGIKIARESYLLPPLRHSEGIAQSPLFEQAELWSYTF